MLFIEEFGMELYAEEWSRGVLHRLNVGSFVRGGLYEISWKIFHFITM